MTVRKSERSETKLEVLDLSRKLAAHTITVCKSQSAFPKSQRWIFTQRLVDEAVGAYCCIRQANATLLRQGPNRDSDYAQRREMQVMAHAHLNALMGLIDLAHELGNVGARAEFWGRLAADTNEKLKAWMRSDERRYLAMATTS